MGLFQGILGRLNGKDEVELKKEEEHRGNLERTLYVERKFGGMSFVRGGFLVGDRIEDAMPAAEKAEKAEIDTALPLTEVPVASAQQMDTEEASADEPKRKSKKRKSESMEVTESDRAGKKKRRADADADLTTKKTKSNKKRRRTDDGLGVAATPADPIVSNAPSQLTSAAPSQPTSATSTRSSSPSSPDNKAERKRRKEEKRVRKEAKRLEKEQKRAKKEAKRQKKAASASDTSSSEEEADGTTTDTGHGQAVAVKEPAAAAVKPAISFSGGRHAVRQRYIRQKKMASMDPGALKEIFMIKA